MAYCCLILFGKLIQQIVFGHLRVVEQQVNEPQIYFTDSNNRLNTKM